MLSNEDYARRIDTAKAAKRRTCGGILPTGLFGPKDKPASRGQGIAKPRLKSVAHTKGDLRTKDLSHERHGNPHTGMVRFGY